MLAKSCGIFVIFFLFTFSVLASEGHESSGLLDLKPGLSLWTIVTFLVLLAVLSKFAWKPMLQSLEEREQHIRNHITNAEQSHQQADKLLDETKQKLNNANNEARGIVETANQRANQIRQQAVVQTERECSNIKLNSQKQIHAMQTKAVEDVLLNVSDLSLNIASKMIQKSLTADDHSRLIADSVADMRQKLKG